jgi:hypothetical protein
VPTSDPRECAKIAEAFERATKAFGQDTARLLRSLLEEKHGIRIGTCPCSTLEEIEAALFELAGVAACS